MNIKIANHNTKLSGAIAVAYGLMAAGLNTTLAQNAKRNTWSESLTFVVAAIGDDVGEDAIVKAEAAIKSIADAVKGRSVLEALSEAGYGQLDKVEIAEDGKEMAPTRVSAVLAARFGKKFKLSRAIDNSLKTLAVYQSRFVAALRAGVVLDSLMTGRELNEAVVKAKREAMSDEARAEMDAIADVRKVGNRIGEMYADAWKDAQPAKCALIELFNSVLTGFQHADSVLIDALYDSLEPFAAKFDEARIAATATAESKDDESLHSVVPAARLDDALALLEGVDEESEEQAEGQNVQSPQEAAVA